MRKALVVSKFKEDVGWLELLRDFEIVLISKLPGDTTSKALKLPNIGREAHSYLYYIVQRYTELPDLCVFTQGNPFDHSPNFIEQISALSAAPGYRALGDVEAIFDGYGYPQLSASPLNRDKLCFAQFFEEVLGEKSPALFYARMNALFAVDRQTITARPLSFYQRCLALLEAGGAAESDLALDANALEPHFFERLWYFIFTPAWSELPDAALLPGMPRERLKLILPLIEKWPAEVKRTGLLQASSVLLAASEILNS